MTILIAFLGIMLLVGSLAQVRRSRALRRLRLGSRVASTAQGPVEYAAAGSGPAVLLLHGGVGGWDQGVLLGLSLLLPERVASDNGGLTQADSMLRDGFTLIAPSRVGYLRTPLSTGRSPAEGADAMAALLDALKLNRVLVIGVSGGGPTALQFAIRHPDRCAALVMAAAIARRHVQPARTTDSFFVGTIVFSRAFGWFVDLMVLGTLAYAALRPFSIARKLLQATETLDPAGIRRRMDEIRRNPRHVAWMRAVFRTLYPLSARRTGLSNDLAQFAAIEDYPVSRIACPTLVVHGRHDGNVAFDHAEFVARGVPGAELVVAETCGHFLWMSEEGTRMSQAVRGFLLAHAGDLDHALAADLMPIQSPT